MSTVKNTIEARAAALGLYVAYWSPGDGATRYRFFASPSAYSAADGLYTAIGSKDAFTFLAGVATGRQLAALGYRPLPLPARPPVAP